MRGVTVGDDAHDVPLREGPGRLHFLQAGTAQHMMALAEQEATAVVAEAEAARDQAVADGYREGFDAGMADAQQRMFGAIATVQGLAREIEDDLTEMPERLAGEVASMAMELAARLVRADISANPERVVDVARGAIRRATEREVLIAHVNPDDLAVLRDAVPELQLQMGGIRRLDVIEDPRIHAGGVVLETPNGDVDATMESQMRRIVEALAAPPETDLLAQ